MQISKVTIKRSLVGQTLRKGFSGAYTVLEDHDGELMIVFKRPNGKNRNIPSIPVKEGIRVNIGPDSVQFIPSIRRDKIHLRKFARLHGYSSMMYLGVVIPKTLFSLESCLVDREYDSYPGEYFRGLELLNYMDGGRQKVYMLYQDKLTQIKRIWLYPDGHSHGAFSVSIGEPEKAAWFHDRIFVNHDWMNSISYKDFESFMYELNPELKDRRTEEQDYLVV